MRAFSARVLRAALLIGAAATAAGAATGSRVTFVARAPAGTPESDTLWISGDRPELGAWSGAGLRLAPDGRGAWRGEVELPEGAPFAFKVTRGSWATVEKDAHGGEIPNRTAVATAGGVTITIAIGAWRDQTEAPSAPRAHTLTGDVRRHEKFPSRRVPPRDVLVWLPPGYERDSTTRYPVVYFHDGNNVFDGATSFIPGQEWGVDETCDSLVRAGRLPACIVVAVANSPARMREYTLAADARHGGGGLADYAAFLLDELKPFVDRTYRTLPDAAHTGIAGSSLGGLASLDLGLAHPDRFGLVGCVSPSAGWADEDIVRRVRAGRGHPFRLWLDIGTAEDSAEPDGSRPWLESVRRLRDALRERGWRDGADFHYEEVEGARHDERAWAARVGRLLVFLLAR